MSPNQKKWLLIAGSALTVFAGAYYYKYHFFTAPSREEFFAANPQLGSPVEMMTPTPTPVRETDEFKAGDFRLEKGTGYTLTYSGNISNKTNEKKTTSVRESGKVTLASLGIQKGILWIMGRFEISTQGPNGKKQGNPSKELYFGIYPRGGLRHMFVDSPLKSFEELVAPFQILELAFHQIEDKSVGKRRIKTPDPSMKATYLDEEVIQKNPNEIEISLGIELTQKPLGASENRAAAMGSPGTGQFTIEQFQKVLYRWNWLTDQDRPKKQSCDSNNRITFSDTVLGEITTLHELTWASETKGIEDLIKRSKNFKIEVPIEQLRAYLMVRNQIDASDKSKSGSDKLKMPPLGQILGDLRSLNWKTKPDGERDKLLVDLSLQLKANPKLIPFVATRAKDSMGGSEERRKIIGALAFQGGPEAQKAMIEIYKTGNATYDDKSKVMLEFAGASAPLTPETKTFLKDEFESKNPLKDELSNSAGLALGTSISHDGDPEMVKYLREKYAGADKILTQKPEEIEEKKYILTIMGNSKSDVFQKEVTEAAKSDEIALAKAAADSLRFVQKPSLRELLIDFLVHHPHPSVRKMAAQSLGFQPFDQKTIEALRTCCTSETDLPTRVQCYRVIVRHVDFPFVREFLKERQSAEKVDQVINMIMSALSIQESSSK